MTTAKKLPQGSVFAPLLYTNDQPIHPNTRSFVYTDFTVIEDTLSSALVRLTEYDETDQLRANSNKLTG